jgi:hypothetical protein
VRVGVVAVFAGRAVSGCQVEIRFRTFDRGFVGWLSFEVVGNSLPLARVVIVEEAKSIHEYLCPEIPSNRLHRYSAETTET